MTSAERRHTSRVLAVTGADGFVGRYIVRAALGAGWTVRALARDGAKAARTLPTEGVTIVRGDIFDERARLELVKGASAVAHLIGIRREKRPEVTFRRMHVDATRAIVETTRAAGISRYLHMSALGTRPNAASGYHQTKFEAEMLVRRSDLEWTIFRPSMIHGPDGEFVRMVKGWATGRKPPHLFLPFFKRPRYGEGLVPKFDVPTVQPVAVGDVAAAFVGALERPETAFEVYALGGPEPMTWPQMLVAMRDSIPGANVSLQPLGIPADVAAMQAKGAEAMGLGALLPFGPSDAIMGSEDNVCSTAKAEQHLGLRPRALRPSVAAYGGQIE